MIYLGIDGGGSKTIFLLENDRGDRLARVESGSSNWLSVGAESARQAIADGLSRLPSAPDVACGGFAGAGRPEGKEFFTSCLSSLLPGSHIHVETDAFVSYLGAHGLQPGVLLIAGTGSIALARSESGEMVRAGGWGPMFSDDGGGFWIGREAIRHALRLQDSAAGDTPPFVDRVNRVLKLQSIFDIAAAQTALRIDVPYIASAAPVVLEGYPSVPAAAILEEAAEHLRSLAATAARRAALPPSCAKAVAGGIGSHPVMRTLLGDGFVPPRFTAEEGALLWARSFAN